MVIRRCFIVYSYYKKGQGFNTLGTKNKTDTDNPNDYILTTSKGIGSLLAESPEEIIKIKYQIEDLKLLLMREGITI